MDGDELQGLLSAATRELTAVMAHFERSNDRAADAARKEVHDAQEALDEASRLWLRAAAGSAMSAGSGRDGRVPGADHREAHALRAGALRSRDVAEAQLRALRDERAELLEQLRGRTEDRFNNSEELAVQIDAAAAREADLVTRCEEMEKQARTVQAEIKTKTRRIVERGARGHELARHRRLLVRQHNRSMAENARAREILQLEQLTCAHMRKVAGHCDEVDASLAQERRTCEERARALQAERAEQEARYEEEAKALEDKLAELQREYEERWKGTERDAQSRLDETGRQIAEARLVFERQCAELDAERESEAASAREQIEQQKLRLVEAREAALAEMEEKLSQKRLELQAKADAEHRRCDSMRNQLLQRADDHARECERYRTNIHIVRDNYSSSPKKDLLPSPRMTAPSGRPLI